MKNCKSSRRATLSIVSVDGRKRYCSVISFANAAVDQDASVNKWRKTNNSSMRLPLANSKLSIFNTARWASVKVEA